MKNENQIQTIDPEQEDQIQIVDPEQEEILNALEETFLKESEEVVEEGFCAWYMGILAEIDAADIALDKLYKEQYHKMKKKINNRRNALSYACGEEFKARVDAMIEAGARDKTGKLTKKSINFLTGAAGYRTQKEKVHFTHLPTAVKWALENMDVEQLIRAIGKIDKTALIVRYLKSFKDSQEIRDSISALNKTPFLEVIKSSGEMPDGVELVEATEKFFPEIFHKELTGKDMPLIGETDGK